MQFMEKKRQTTTMESSNDHFWGHVDALRSTLIRVLATIALAMSVVLFFHRPIIDFFTSPLESSAIKTESITQSKITNTSSNPVSYYLQHDNRYLVLAPNESLTVTETHPPKLAIFSPSEGLTTILKVCFWVGAASSAPIWLYWIYLFVAPALHTSEKRLFIPFALFSLCFSLLGVTFCYLFTIPIANQYLNGFNAKLGMNVWGLEHYLNYTLILLAANAIAFEACVALFFLVHYGKISEKGMSKYRKHVIVSIFTLSAILTPPDVFTQVMMALPLMGFYELGIVYARIRRKSRCSQILTHD